MWFLIKIVCLDSETNIEEKLNSESGAGHLT